MKIKSITDYEQSRVLSEILPKDSADMHHFSIGEDVSGETKMIDFCEPYIETQEPAWSLAALIEILPAEINEGTDNYARLEITKGRVGYYRSFGAAFIMSCQKNMVDNCFNIILELNRRGLISKTFSKENSEYENQLK